MTFDKFVNILVTSRVIAPEAISDPDNYDDNCMLENVRAAYRRLTKPTAGMTFGQARIDEAVEAEREACAKVCESEGVTYDECMAGQMFAREIRARNQPTKGEG